MNHRPPVSRPTGSCWAPAAAGRLPADPRLVGSSTRALLVITAIPAIWLLGLGSRGAGLIRSAWSHRHAVIALAAFALTHGDPLRSSSAAEW